MVKNIKLNTFFFKEYAQITEKSSYSAYIPNGSKGIWCIAAFNEKIDEKMQEKSEISQKFENSNVENKKIDKINLAKIGVHKIIEKYLENNEFSLENIEQIIQSSIDKVVFEKTKLYKFHKAEKDFDLKNFYSQIVIIIEKNNMIVGNMGKTKFVLYRKNKIVEKISGEQVKKIRLKKHDYLLVGSPEFWKIINENEIEEVYVDKKSKENIEQSLSEQIKLAEKKLGKVIPFLSIFVEDIEMEKNYELLESEVSKKNQKREMAVKYIFLSAMFAFMLVSVGKNIQKGNFENRKNENVKNVMTKKISEKSNLLENNLYVKAEIENNKIEQGNLANVKVEVKKTAGNENAVENQNVETGNKEIEKNHAKNLEITQNITKSKEKGAKKLNNSRIKKKVFKNKKYNRKNLNADNRNFKKNYKVKSNGISQLEKEIEKNWEVLGRDRNGNNFVKNREFKRENKNGFFIKGNNIEWEV
ncbi:hypothetical protein JMUB4039_1889 [Leptotrichia trevisanii]|uniref:Uncharacterized protein n=1 Tax=Leptotrichia trevisanii TaxID=109328 RepID=A0A510L2X8_9FUSO|nr:hypothetical protein [Leptotrichia trevisanii]BBM53116.1 hypothetical protein JMUB3935_2098 [Leptotrichia trevisanii]BBM57907.1 hypothetical protein JMUB4039_1889 [Leptotrichia trevisanii]